MPLILSSDLLFACYQKEINESLDFIIHFLNRIDATEVHLPVVVEPFVKQRFVRLIQNDPIDGFGGFLLIFWRLNLNFLFLVLWCEDMFSDIFFDNITFFNIVHVISVYCVFLFENWVYTQRLSYRHSSWQRSLSIQYFYRSPIISFQFKNWLVIRSCKISRMVVCDLQASVIRVYSCKLIPFLRRAQRCVYRHTLLDLHGWISFNLKIAVPLILYQLIRSYLILALAFSQFLLYRHDFNFVYITLLNITQATLHSLTILFIFLNRKLYSLRPTIRWLRIMSQRSMTILSLGSVLHYFFVVEGLSWFHCIFVEVGLTDWVCLSLGINNLALTIDTRSTPIRTTHLSLRPVRLSMLPFEFPLFIELDFLLIYQICLNPFSSLQILLRSEIRLKLVPSSHIFLDFQDFQANLLLKVSVVK